MWDKGLLAPDSPLLSLGPVAKLPAADAASLADVVEALLLQHAHRLQGARTCACVAACMRVCMCGRVRVAVCLWPCVCVCVCMSAMMDQ